MAIFIREKNNLAPISQRFVTFPSKDDGCPELATAMHPGVKIDPGANGRHGNQLITSIVASVVSRMVLALLCREWRVCAYSC